MKKKIILISSIGAGVLLIALLLILLFATDIFKSPQQLFFKYFSQNERFIDILTSDLNASYEQKKKQTPYVVDGELTVIQEVEETTEQGNLQPATENEAVGNELYIANGTTNNLENETTDGAVNETAEEMINDAINTEANTELFRIITEGKVDQKNQKKYYKARLTKNNQELLSAKYLNTDDLYALASDQVVTKYVAIDRSNQEELSDKISSILPAISASLVSKTQENSENEGTQENQEIQQNIAPSQETETNNSEIPNIGMMLGNMVNEGVSLESFRLTEEEKNILTTEYNTFIAKSLEKRKFTKNNKVNITIDGQNYKAKQYTLTTTTKELQELILQVLERNQILTIMVNKYNKAMPDSPITIGELQQQIQQLEQRINAMQIRDQQVQISLYVANNQLLKTEIKAEDNVIAIEYVKGSREDKITVTSEKELVNGYDSIELRKTDTEDRYVFTVTLTSLKNTKNSITLQISKVGNVNSSTIRNLHILTIANDNSKYTVKYNDSLNFENEVQVEELNQDNSITINNYSTEELQSLLIAIAQRTKQVWEEAVAKILSNDPNLGNEPIDGNTENEGGDNQQQGGTELSETEKLAIDMYNEQFVPYLGDRVQAEQVKQLINTVSASVQNQNEVKVNYQGTYNGTNVTKIATTIEELEDLKVYIVQGKDYKTEGIADTTGKLVEVTIEENTNNT